MGITVLLLTQAWSGAPLYVLASVAQGLWLHQRAGFKIVPILGCALLSTALAILAGVVIWGNYFAGQNIMLWEAVNLPALVASVLVFPVVGLLMQFGFNSRN